MNTIDWYLTSLASDESHHLLNDQPFYQKRFHKVLKYHAPGIAPVEDESGAYHIDTNGFPLYSERHIKTFGFYENRAAVMDADGWYHINTIGKPAYNSRYTWCGNFQEKACTVKEGSHYFHIDLNGHRIYPESYCYVGDYREGYAVILDKRGLYTHIDQAGRLLHGKWFLGLNVFHKGLACAKDQEGWFHVDKQGSELYKRRFRSVENFYNTVAYAETHQGQILTINQNGETIAPIGFEHRTESSILHELSADLVGYWKTQTLHAAIQLKILDHLPADLSTIAKAINLTLSHCQRLLRALQELNIVNNSSQQWQLTSKGQLLAPSMNSPMAAATMVWAENHYLQWLNLAERLHQESISQNYFKTLIQSPNELKIYHQALSIYAYHDYQAIIDIINWNQHKHVIDAGGGTGSLLHLLLHAHNNLQGILLELPSVIDLIDEQMKHPRAQYIGTDLFNQWPYTADAILFARVLHDWNDEQALQLLKQAKSHLSSNGKIYILEMILSSTSSQGGLLDLNMLVMTGGKERSLTAWNELASKASLKIVSLHECSNVVSLLVLEKMT